MRRLLTITAVLAAGCADMRASRVPPVLRAGPPDAAYRIGPADVLSLRVDDRPAEPAVVDLDGRVQVNDTGRPRVDGLTPPEAAAAVAETLGVEPARVAVGVAAPLAARICVIGPTNGRRQWQPYCGPETAYEMLVRAGMFTPAATRLSAIAVVRPNVAAGRPSQVFPAGAGVELQPSDLVYVAESWRSSFGRLLPEWAKPTYNRVVGLGP